MGGRPERRVILRENRPDIASAKTVAQVNYRGEFIGPAVDTAALPQETAPGLTQKFHWHAGW